jgi:hypothetical protein
MRVTEETLDLLTESASRTLWLRNKLERERKGQPIVYIAGPFSGATRADVERNIASAELAGLAVARMGAFPFIPHANTRHPAFEEAQPYDFWIAGTVVHGELYY